MEGCILKVVESNIATKLSEIGALRLLIQDFHFYKSKLVDC